jgi:hypothetical protein
MTNVRSARAIRWGAALVAGLLAARAAPGEDGSPEQSTEARLQNAGNLLIGRGLSGIGERA